MKIQCITAEQTHNLRQKVLRKNQESKECKFEGDEVDGTLHYGLFLEDKICAILSLFETSHQLFNEHYQVQLRGMAIDESYQGQGLGSQLLVYVLEDLKHQKPNVERVWCNAREVAYRFYQKQGFEFNSEPFEIPNIGTHRVMSKIVSPVT